MSNAGRPKEENRPIRKEIRLTIKQAKKWNPDNIRNFLKNGKKISTKREGKDTLIPLMVKYLKKEKEKIPIEVVRALELFLRAIKER